MANTSRSSVLISVVASALTTLVVLGIVLFAAPLYRSTSTQHPTPSLSILQTEEEQTVNVVKQTQSAVVAIQVYGTPSRLQGNVQFDAFPFDPFGGLSQIPTPPQPSGPTQIGGGSGFFVTSDGIIVTNKHVLDFPNATFKVQTTDGRTLNAKVLARDPSLDIGFLKVDGTNFPFLTFDNSDAIVPGQTVIAIGNALDEFRNTVTKGVVSGLNRHVIAGDGADSELIEEAIQTDAAINPGNSGGPLIDLAGHVVGLNTAVSEQGQSLGFALPSNIVSRDVDSVKTIGRVARPFLGVRYQIITPELLAQNKLKADHGALVVRGSLRGESAITSGSPAEKAGIVENDIILDVDGTSIDEDHSLASLIGKHSPGDTVTLTVLHAGAQKKITVKLDELKP